MSIAEALANSQVVKAELNIGGVWVDVTEAMARREALSRMAPAHPVFRWQVNATLLAHRRSAYSTPTNGLTRCGRQGELTVVIDDGIPPCPKCYPA